MKPDFEALRAERNEKMIEFHQRFANEHKIPLSSIERNWNPNACYCACVSGGPCEHTWDGPGYTSGDGCTWSATCSRCGCTAMSHDMRVLP